MGKRIFYLGGCLLFFAFSVRGQCPDKHALWEHIQDLHILIPQNETRLSIEEKLKDLSGWLDKINQCPDKNDSAYALVLRKIGTLYSWQGDFVNATQYFQRYIHNITSKGKLFPEDPQRLAIAYFWLTAYYDTLDNVAEKKKALDSCISIYLRYGNGDTASYLRSLSDRAIYYYNVGDYKRCVEDASQCEKLAWEYANHASDKRNIQFGKTSVESSGGWKVNALLMLGEYGAAEKYLATKVDECKKAGLNNYLGTIYDQMARVQEHKGNYDKALLFLNQALKYDEQCGYDLNCKQIMNSIGNDIYFRHFNNSSKALLSFRNAFRYINKDEAQNKTDSFESLNILGNMANLYIANGLYDSAFSCFQSAFNYIKPRIDENYVIKCQREELMQYKKIFYLTSLVIDKADAFWKEYKTSGKTGQLSEAIRVYKAADLLLNRVKAEQSDAQSKLFWLNDTRRLYEHAIDACYAQYNVDGAFYFFERSRAVLLNDQLNQQRGLAEEDIMKQTQVQKKINQFTKELGLLDEKSPEYLEVQQKLSEQQSELEGIQTSIQTKNPLYYQSFIDSTIITLQDVKKNILKDHQALVEIFSGDSAVYLLTITPKNSQLKKIDKSQYESLSNRYIAYLSREDFLNRNRDDFIRTSYDLYQLLFKDNPLPPGRIIISPGGRYFPFEAFVTTPSRHPVYFLNNYAPSYTYSARYLLNYFLPDSKKVSKNFMGIAPVNYPKSMNLLGLNKSDESLKLLQSYFSDGDNFIQAAASKNNFMQNFPRYKIIQLYTHATDSGETGEPVIYFADSTLDLSELVSENKPATRLIVLSACETGLGKEYKGEGVFSFNRGFAALGIPAAVTNLWSVDNESTYKITELFYKYLSSGLPTDVAMQKAKLEFLSHASRRYELPFYWAPAIVAGKTESFVFQKKNRVLYEIILILALVGLFFLAWRRTGKRKINFQ